MTWSAAASGQPLLVRAFFVLLLCVWLKQIHTQHVLHEPQLSSQHSEPGKNHLRGIRRLNYNRYLGRDDDFGAVSDSSNELTATMSPPRRRLQHMATPVEPRRNDFRIPTAIRTPSPPTDSAEREEQSKRRPPVASAPPLTSLNGSKASSLVVTSTGKLKKGEERKTTTRSQLPASTTKEPPVLLHSSSSESSDDKRRTNERRRLERIQSRWKKIGPLVGGARSSPYQRVRLVHQRRLTSIGHPTTVAQTRSTELSTGTTTPATTTTTTAVIESLKERQRPKQIVAKEPKAFDPTSVRRQAPSTSNTRQQLQQLLRARVYNNRIAKQQRQRSRINGPVLAPPLTSQSQESEDEEKKAATPAAAVVGAQKQFAVKTAPEGPKIVEQVVASSEQEENDGGENTRNDYHHRKEAAVVEKKFKLVPNKVSYRPRLKIRRPGEQPQQTSSQLQQQQFPVVAAGTTKGGHQRPSSPISLPELAPLQSKQRVFPSLPNLPMTSDSSPFDAQGQQPFRLPSVTKWESSEKGEEQPPLSGSSPVAGAAEERVLVSSGGNPSPIPAPPSRPTLPVSSPPQHVSSPSFKQDEATGAVGEQSPQPSQPSPVESYPSTESSSGGGGNSGLAFGGDIGTPPLGFREAFGLSGDETNLNLGGDSAPATTAPATTTTKARSTAAPTTKMTTTEETFVIPENSGLRPVSPPKEFQGGFGSSGSFGGGSGGGGLGGSPFASQPSPTVRPQPTATPRNNVQIEPPTAPPGTAEEIFTGDSAFVPNRRGPNGDGYGPPVLPEVAAPPVAPAINYGGGAAGIAPFKPSQIIMETAENQATTVKPSALLTILTKADEGFNQVISHFERGTPIEAAAIDVLEVALGSQKLDSQAKLLSHVDRTIGLDNIQRLQRWANTGGALDILKEQFAKMAKNYKPPPETKAITIPPQLEYLFQSSSGGRRR